jgi:hypothetical protein
MPHDARLSVTKAMNRILSNYLQPIGINPRKGSDLPKKKSLHFFSFCLLIIVAQLLLPAMAMAIDVTIQWAAVSAPTLAGYRVFYREAGQNYDYANPDWQGTNTSCTLYNLTADATYFFMVRAYDSSGNESGNSNEAAYYPPDTNNQSPQPPLPSSPLYNEGNISLMPILQAEPFSDQDAGDGHHATQWQIFAASGTVVFDVTSTKALTSISVPPLVLTENTSYFWRVRYYDSSNSPSIWSDDILFTTEITGADRNADGIPDDQEVNGAADLDNDGNQDFLQANIKNVYSMVGDGSLAVGYSASSNVVAIDAIEAINPASVQDTKNRPASLPMGLISFRIRVRQVGDTADITVYFSEPAPAGAHWYKYDSVDGWQDYSEHASFSADGGSIFLQLQDGGYGDSDGAANGIIVDPSGFGLISSPAASAGTPANPQAGTGGGCFIAAAWPPSLSIALHKFRHIISILTPTK